MTISHDFIGRGWGSPARISRAGAVLLIGDGEELDAAIRTILSTRPGERVMRPDFGCAIWSLVFDPLTIGVLGLIDGPTGGLDPTSLDS